MRSVFFSPKFLMSGGVLYTRKGSLEDNHFSREAVKVKFFFPVTGAFLG